jgi:hypothetical protein
MAAMRMRVTAVREKAELKRTSKLTFQRTFELFIQRVIVKPRALNEALAKGVHGIGGLLKECISMRATTEKGRGKAGTGKGHG